MRFCIQFLLLFIALPLVVCGFSDRHSFYGVEEKGTAGEFWDYVTVRPKAHMFYWVYNTTHKSGYKNRPFILWLQGGPGGSSTGFGNFEELGPLDIDLKPRNTTWLQTASLLFIDNPVGTGYSYVEDKSAYTTNVAEIAADLLTLMKAFVKKHPDFKKIPFYIFSESYGGKMTAAFSDVLYQAIQAGDIEMDFKGFAMGNSWISPIDSCITWGPFLYATSIVDDAGLESIQKKAREVEDFVNKGDFIEAEEAWGDLEYATDVASHGVNIYNILNWGAEHAALKREILQTLKFQPKTEFGREYLKLNHLRPLQNDKLYDLMNGPIKKKLKIIPVGVTWGGQKGRVFEAQHRDFMRNVTATVNKLINTTPLKVVVYQGQLDVICDILGAEKWFSSLDIAEEFYKVKRELKSCQGHPIACYYQRVFRNVQFYWILEAGHMVPSDNGYGALDMVNNILKEDSA